MKIDISLGTGGAVYQIRELQWLNALRDEKVVAGMQLYIAKDSDNKRRHRPSPGDFIPPAVLARSFASERSNELAVSQAFGLSISES